VNVLRHIMVNVLRHIMVNVLPVACCSDLPRPATCHNWPPVEPKL
jgi:hypothetical protein